MQLGDGELRISSHFIVEKQGCSGCSCQMTHHISEQLFQSCSSLTKLQVQPVQNNPVSAAWWNQSLKPTPLFCFVWFVFFFVLFCFTSADIDEQTFIYFFYWPLQVSSLSFSLHLFCTFARPLSTWPGPRSRWQWGSDPSTPGRLGWTASASSRCLEIPQVSQIEGCCF